MRVFSRRFTDVKSQLAGVEPHKFFQIHGIRCTLEPQCVFVELGLCSDLPFDAIPVLLFATHSLYSRSQPSCKLVIIIDAQNCTSSSDVLSVSTALCSFSFSCHSVVERVYWVGIELSNEVQSSISKDLSDYKIQNIFVQSASSLKQYLDGACYSTNLDGCIQLDIAEQFFRMRYSLEDFLNKTHRIAKLYMNLHDELRRYMATNSTYSATYEEVCDKETDLKSRWHALEEDADRKSLVNDGSRICSELLNKFPLLESCDPFLYKDAVKQAAKAFDEVVDVMKRSDSTLQKRQKSLEAARYALEFLDYKKNVSVSLKVDVHELERVIAVKTFNINRLTAQLEKIKKIRERIQCSLSDATERAGKLQRLLEEDFNIIELNPVELQKEVEDFFIVLASVRTRIDEILNFSLHAVEARRAVDKTYDWALLCAKKSDIPSEVNWLISSFPTEAVKVLKQSLAKGALEEMVSKEISTLLDDVMSSMRKISGNPSWEIEAVNGIANGTVEAKFDLPYAASTSDDCLRSRGHSALFIDDSINNHQISGFNIENFATGPQLGFEDRLSLLFKSTSLSSSFTSLPSSNDHSTASLISPNGDQFVEAFFPYEKSVHGRSLTAEVAKVPVITELEPVQSSCSDTARESGGFVSDSGFDCTIGYSCLVEQGSENLSSSTSSGMTVPVLCNTPNATTECCSSVVSDTFDVEKQNPTVMNCGASSMRCTSPSPTQYEVPISKSNASDNAETEQEFVEELDCKEETEIRWRRNSWSSLPRVDETLSIDERAIGGAPVTLDLTDKIITCMSSNTLIKRLGQRRSVSGFPARLPNPFLINGIARPGSARFSSTYRTRPALSRLFPLEPIDQDRFSIASSFQLPPEDASFTSEVIYSNLTPAHSVVDFSLRSDQIEHIRNGLNPSKTSNANFRIECTVVRDMLDSEIDYVKSLRTVVQDFVPEMSRPELPVPLRGKKTLLFGNIEKLFQFHAHTFLPQLISRLRFRPTEESLSLTVGSLFVEHALSFNLYSLYAKNKPKADVLMRESGSSFFSSLKVSKDLANLLVRPIERIGKYTLALQQLLNATSPSKMEILEILQKAVSVVGCQIRHGADLLAMERITGCDLNLREQGTLLRNDTMFVTEKRGLYAKKRMRSVFLFTNCVVITKPRLRKDHGGKSYDELRYKGSIQMTDCGLTEMVKTSKTKFELWFRKQTASFTYILETQSPSVRDLWVDDIRSLLWKQAIKSREDSLREKANMGLDSSTASLLPLGPVYTPVILRNRDWGDGTRRPCSLISLTASSCSSSNNATLRGSNTHGHGTGEVIAGDLGRVEEADESDLHNRDYSCSLPRFNAPPPPSEAQ